jgi:hypothetical protein
VHALPLRASTACPATQRFTRPCSRVCLWPLRRAWQAAAALAHLDAIRAEVMDTVAWRLRKGQLLLAAARHDDAEAVYS